MNFLLGHLITRRLRSGLLLVLLAGAGCGKDEARPTPPPASAGPAVAASEAVVYEAFVRAASAAGTFEGLIPRLDSIKSLGCNVLWLMPIHPIGQLRRVGSKGSPYSVRDYTAPHPDLGDLAAFDRLVAAAHQRGLVVVLDWVANHTSWDHAWITQHPDWYTRDASGTIQSPLPAWQDVADLNYSQPALRREMIRAMRFWVQRHGVDGFRLDAADMVPDSFWKEALDSLNRVRPNLFWLAEGGSPSHYASGAHLIYGWEFYPALAQVFRQNADASLLGTTHARELQNAPLGRYRLRFTTNHDFSFTDGTPPEWYGSAAAAQAAFVATLAYGATPLVYNGQEAGDPARLSLFEKQTIRWEYSPATTRFYRRLLKAHNELPALRTGTVSTPPVAPGIVSVLRANAQQRVAVLVNVRSQATTLTLPAAWQSTAWVDALSGQAVPATASLTLPAYGYVVWKN
ncbi:alpha-amylase family glycosyl hydrolase [Hymenobacter weizhouensis]|uniref:alpha-amylase family glycosyl hydrolase n=1 Tax=Hymenobacter sp. YIM 151500-1 TaxID=2987689 RepID=UPI00222807A9|nr:alpha-amylase family glycosyl hydrolase [Hymenobacter sp. YIM 151500-1]UYZ64005.1 alpha-amylase family glycosyl hydrolase [Hymenobacter sp. YIM 151500-1]